ncbi:MAG: Two-component response regulator [Labilithrix sp.]|nr:Two-component response regulator [Labilithrix sp.]
MRAATGNALESALTATASATSLRDVGEHVLPHLARAVGASAALLYRYDDEGRLTPIAGALAGEIHHYASHYLDIDPIQQFPRRLDARPRVVHATRHVDKRSYRRSAAYGEFYAPFELEHLVCAWLTHVPYGSPGMTGLLFARPPSGEDFASSHHALLARALPALAATAARAERLRDLDLQKEALEALVGATDGPARLVLSPAGKVIWASPACERLLGAARGPSLETIRNAVTRANEQACTLTVRLGSDTVRIHLAHVRAASGAPLLLVELERDRTEKSAPGGEIAQRFGLTRAEAAVLAIMCEGLGNAAIAARLFVSVETVRTHVGRVLSKLGARSRTEAVVLARGAPIRHV